MPFKSGKEIENVLHYWNKETIAFALREIGQYRAPLLSELTCLINDFNCWDKSEDYYDLVAGDWLMQFIHLTYAAALQGREIEELKPLGTPIPVSSDLFAHSQLYINKSALHQHLREAVSYLLSGGSPASWQFSEDSVHISTAYSQSFNEKAIRMVSTRSPEVLLVEPYFKCAKAEASAALIKWRKWAALDNLKYSVNLVVQLDTQWRISRACDGDRKHDFLSVLKALLPLHLPVALLEGFDAYRNAALAMPVFRPKAVYSANALHANLTFKLLSAEWRQEGTRLLYHQHGGCYGTDLINDVEQYESRVADRFYTWGWEIKGNPKIRSLSPAPPHKPSRKKRYILLNCVDYPLEIYRIHFLPMSSGVQTMQRETCEFLAKLSDRRDLFVRPYFFDYSGNFVDMMRQAAPDAEFDDKSATSFERFAQSRLVVHNYLGTAYLETLALNVPTICFYDPNTYAFRSEAEPFMNDLESVGILHRSGIDAARFVAGLGSDPQEWWSKLEVQLARHAFIEQYANFSSDWKREWEAEFRSAIESAS